MAEGLEQARARLAARAEVLGVLGAGASGLVVEARLPSGVRVAIKLLSPALSQDPVYRERLLREARAAGAVDHPAVVRVLEVDQDQAFIVMELVEGESLAERLRRGALGAGETREIARALLGALGAAHAAGIVHRDVKPSNVLLAKDGRVKLGDFGVARTGDARLTDTGGSVGTPAYAAPEQLRGHADARSDLYALGATLFEAASGTPLHAEDRWIADRAAHVTKASGDPVLAAAIARALEERPEDRFQSAAEFERVLLGTKHVGRMREALAASGLVLGISLAIGGLWWRAYVREEANKPSLSSRAALQQGQTALRDDRLNEALAALGLALNETPNDARVHYNLAFAYWWGSRDDSEVLFHLDRARALGVSDAERSFLDGLALLVKHDDSAAVYFEAAVARRPENADLRYGYFEALFHGGRCDEAVSAYRALLERSDGWRLGAFHVATLAVERGDAELLAWVSNNARFASDPKQAGWPARWSIARADYARASELVAAARAGQSGLQAEAQDSSLFQLALAARLLSGDAAGAERIAREGSGRGLEDRVMAYGMAVALGRDVEPARGALFSEMSRSVASGDNVELAVHLALTEAASGRDQALRDLIAQAPERNSALDPRVAMAELLGTALLERPVPPPRSPHAEVRALAAALTQTAPAEQQLALERAARSSCDGRLVASYDFLSARAAHKAGDDDGVLAACRRVIQPRSFRWEWSALVRPCLDWSLKIEKARGHEAEARAWADMLARLH